MGVLPFQRGHVPTRRLWILSAALLVSWLLPSTIAAVPTAARVTAKAEQALSRVKPVRLTYTEVRKGAPARVAMRLVVVPGVGVRTERLSLSGDKPSDRAAQIWHVDAPVAEGSRPLEEAPVWLQLLAGRGIGAVLQAAGVNTGRVSLAHADGTILWVVGAGPQERDRPQLHVVRATGRPWRVISAPSQGVEEGVEQVLFEGAATPSEEDTSWWPMALTFTTVAGSQRFELTAIERGPRGASEDLLAPRASPAGGPPK